MRGRLVVDGRNCLDGEAIAAGGGVYLSIGRRPRGVPRAASGAAVETPPVVMPALPLG
jgi:hypothetical protein